MNFLRRKFLTSTINKCFNKQKYLFDSFPIVWNIQKSQNSFLYDIHTNEEYLDFHGGFGSNPIGWNHPKLLEHFKNNIIIYD